MTKNSANETTAKTTPPANGQDPDDLSAYQITNPQEFAENMFRLVEESGKAMTQMWLHSPDQSGPMSATHELVEASRTMTEIAALDNVVCKISGLTAYCAPESDRAQAIAPYVDHVLSVFGTDRFRLPLSQISKFANSSRGESIG